MELPDKEIIRITETIDTIPQDVVSILEVGCGNGSLSKPICNKFKLTGIDIDNDIIKTFPGKKITADVANLPIREAKFDLVLVPEVLEHLEDESLISALKEILCVAKKYILITVPFEENLSAQWVKCSKCAHIFHVWGHVNRFDLGTLKNLFKDDTLLIEKRFLSPKERRVPSLLYDIAKKLGNAWGTNLSDHILCPKCRSKPFQCEGNLLGKILIKLIWRIKRVSPLKNPIWIGCLYKKIN
jgi:SAM-dependent methyltransferase